MPDDMRSPRYFSSRVSPAAGSSPLRSPPADPESVSAAVVGTGLACASARVVQPALINSASVRTEVEAKGVGTRLSTADYGTTMTSPGFRRMFWLTLLFLLPIKV